MTKHLLCCSVARIGSVDELVGLLLSEEHRPLIEEYRSAVENDPQYFRFHCTSVALRLQYELKLHDLPSISIGECLETNSSTCCVLDSLEEALRRSSNLQSVGVQGHHSWSEME